MPTIMAAIKKSPPTQISKFSVPESIGKIRGKAIRPEAIPASVAPVHLIIGEIISFIFTINLFQSFKKF